MLVAFCLVLKILDLFSLDDELSSPLIPKVLWFKIGRKIWGSLSNVNLLLSLSLNFASISSLVLEFFSKRSRGKSRECVKNQFEILSNPTQVYVLQLYLLFLVGQVWEIFFLDKKVNLLCYYFFLTWWETEITFFQDILKGNNAGF